MKYHENSILFSLTTPFRSILSCLLLVALPMLVLGQAPSSVSQEQIEKLDFMIGEWKGKGWMYRPDGSRGAELSQSTKVNRGKDSSTLSIKDKKSGEGFRIALGGGSLGTVLNYPLLLSGTASIYYDERAKLYYWRWETPAGRKNPFAAKLAEPNVLQVKLEFPGSLAVTSITVTANGEWHERQDLWMGDKGGWVRIQETVLKKMK